MSQKNVPTEADRSTPKHTGIGFKSEKGGSDGKGPDFDPCNWPGQKK